MSSYPSTIKAIQYSSNGGGEVIQLDEVPFPTQAPDEVLVKVEWAGVNFIDIYHRTGLYPSPSFPAPVGIEAAGIIERLPTDSAILESERFKALGFRVGGKVALVGTTRGALAQYASRRLETLAPVPEPVSTRNATASLVQGLTALTFTEEAYNVQSGDWILVHAAAGGLGLLLTQVLKSRGANVIGTTSTVEKAEIAKKNGVDHVILSHDPELAKKILDLTNGLGVHAVYDGVGHATSELDFEVARRKGTIVFVGNASGPVPPFPPLKLSPKNLKVVRPIVGNYMVTPEETTYYGTKLWSSVISGALKVQIHKEYEFTREGVAQAQSDLESRKTTGKLLIKVQ